MPLTFAKSQRSKDMLVADGFMYYKKKSKENRVMWRCIFHEKKKCRGNCVTWTEKEDGYIISTNDHNHGPDPAAVEARRVISDIKTAATTTNKSTRNLVTGKVAGLSNSVRAKLPNKKFMFRIVKRQRLQNNVTGLPNPITIAELVIPEEYTVTAKGERFLWFDSQCEKRFLIFTTFANLLFLKGCDVWYCDGAFKSLPSIFDRLYIFHGARGRDVFALVYVLMSSQTDEIYVTVVKTLKKLQTDLNPKRIMVDFELGAINALAKGFPECEIKGSYFHFNQCLWHNIQRVGLQTRYGRDDEFASELRMLAALAFVPEGCVFAYYESLIESQYYLDNEDELRSILDYFEKEWVGEPARRDARPEPYQSISVWNHYSTVLNNTDKTNKSFEEWHRAFNSRIEACRLGTWKFLDTIVNEQGVQEACIQKFNTGEIHVGTKKRKYPKADARLLDVVNYFHKYNPIEYLRKVAVHIGF